MKVRTLAILGIILILLALGGAILDYQHHQRHELPNEIYR